VRKRRSRAPGAAGDAKTPLLQIYRRKGFVSAGSVRLTSGPPCQFGAHRSIKAKARAILSEVADWGECNVSIDGERR